MSRVDKNRESAREPWLREVDPDAEGPSWIETYRKHILITAAVVLVAFGGAIWYAYQAGSNAGGEAPLVQAPEGTIRHKPEEPGGMTVPDRDKLVYSRVNGTPGAEDVQLRPGPELPLDAPESAPVVPEDALTGPSGGMASGEMASGDMAMVDPLGERAPSAAIVEDREAVPPAPATAAAPSPVPSPVPSSVPAKPATAPKPASSVPSAQGSYMLQLGAFGTEAAANAAWDAARKKFSVLGGLSRDVDVLTRDGKTLYRLRGGSYADKAAADTACAQLKAGSHACFVAKK